LIGSIGKARQASASVARSGPAFAASYGRIPDRSIQSTDALEYYGQHIPWAGSLILRIRQHTKDHPQLTRVLKFLVPAN
jgi:hypothetical protein